MQLNKIIFRVLQKKCFSTSSNSLIITNACANRINSLRTISNNPLLNLRISVDSGGCSGFKYDITIDDIPITDNDNVFEKDNATVITDKISYDFIKGSTIDFKQEMIRSAFTVTNNPQSESACGCGSSFAQKNFERNK